MTSRTITASVAIVFVVGLAVFSFAAAQPPRQGGGDPVIQELRMLRQTLEGDLVFQMQIELAAQRANAAQMRVSAYAVELATVRSQLAEVVGQVTQAAEAVKRMEALVPPGTTINTTMPIGEQYYVMKDQLKAGQQRQAQLQARESQLVAAMAAEQARLDAANRRLDDLERTLTQRR